jgi:hypothetical protein
VSFTSILTLYMLANLQFTKPFVSSRISRVLQSRLTVQFHMPLDDLESFLWVLLYTILEIGHCYDKLDPGELPWLRAMAEEDETRLGLRTVALRSAVLNTRTFRASDHLLIFREILKKWADIAQGSEEELEMALCFDPDPDNLVEISKSTYAEYLRCGFEELSQLPVSWNEGWAYGAALRKARQESGGSKT